MMAATTTWLIDKTTLVAALASLTTGKTNEAMSPTTASATKVDLGRLAQRRHAAPSTVPATPPSSRAAHAMFITGIRAK
jgi:hypothetical protein